MSGEDGAAVLSTGIYSFYYLPGTSISTKFSIIVPAGRSKSVRVQSGIMHVPEGKFTQSLVYRQLFLKKKMLLCSLYASYVYKIAAC